MRQCTKCGAAMRRLGERRDIDYDPEDIERWEAMGRPGHLMPKHHTVVTPLYECSQYCGAKGQQGEAVRT